MTTTVVPDDDGDFVRNITELRDTDEHRKSLIDALRNTVKQLVVRAVEQRLAAVDHDERFALYQPTSLLLQPHPMGYVSIYSLLAVDASEKRLYRLAFRRNSADLNVQPVQYRCDPAQLNSADEIQQAYDLLVKYLETL